MATRQAWALAVAVVAVASRRLWAGSPISPVAYSLPSLPTLPRVGEANAHSLANSKKWFEGRVSGAEHIEFHCPAHASRCKAFTGLSDGSIASFDPDAGPDGPIDILNRTSALEHGNAPNFLQHCGDVEYAHLCGRPLGLKVAPDGKYLIIADAYFGILALDFATREVLLVANEYVDQNGAVQRINMPNSLVITRSGRVLFTQTSPQFSFKNLMLEFMQGRDTGLLLSLSHYAPGAGHRASVAADGLVFPNGLALSPSEDFVLVASSQRAAIIHIRTDDWAKYELVTNLPCIPDNLSLAPPGEEPEGAERTTEGSRSLSVWVGCASKRARPFSNLDFMGSLPSVRRLMAAVMYALDCVQLLYLLAPSAGLVLRIRLPDKAGSTEDSARAGVHSIFYDPKGERVTRVSGAYQDNKGRVFIGSYMHHVQHISVLDLEPNLQP